MYGSYYCNCEIKELLHDFQVRISYIDPVSAELTEGIIDSNRIKWTPGSIGKAAVS
jgi:hypothetical protein